MVCFHNFLQEFGNLQGEEFKAWRHEQASVGRFWYRFPTGESGAGNTFKAPAYE